MSTVSLKYCIMANLTSLLILIFLLASSTRYADYSIFEHEVKFDGKPNEAMPNEAK